MSTSTEATASEDFEFEVGTAVQTTCGNVRGKVRQRVTSANGVRLYIMRDQGGRDRALRADGMIAA
ncbi:hypothetical protein VQ044_20485 [Aurantimonas sp. C2-5-R2]|uniref:hypothetical protein n=1 Tax=Aurantimonas sp. C2-5-R2 TaxID=3113713 RepID=UPI002F91C354